MSLAYTALLRQTQHPVQPSPDYNGTLFPPNPQRGNVENSYA